MSRDLESSRPPAGPYNPPVLPARHPYNIVKRSAIIGGCLYMFHEWDVYHNILKSPNVRHEWFQIGLAASIAILAIKMYVELYMGRIKKVMVDYKSFPQSTHAVIALILFASISFNIALWPVYHSRTLLIMTMFGFGVLLQFALLVPSYVQNAVGFVLLTFFLQEYSAVMR